MTKISQSILIEKISSDQIESVQNQVSSSNSKHTAQTEGGLPVMK